MFASAGNSSYLSGDTVKVAMPQSQAVKMEKCRQRKVYNKKSNTSKKSEFQNGVPSADYIIGL